MIEAVTAAAAEHRARPSGSDAGRKTQCARWRKTTYSRMSSLCKEFFLLRPASRPILDTNVVSEPMTRHPAPQVVTWLDRQDVGTLYLTAVSLAEILAGVRSMPQGKRRDAIETAIERIVQRLRPRILPFDEPAARAFGAIVADARAAGMTISFPDGQIAAIARVNGFTVATRDTQPFVAAGVAAIDPWNASG
jgi:predicted nucleic acid-binding protein